MLCSGAVGKGQAGVCTQKQRQVESWGRKHKSTVFLWDKINTVCLKLNDYPSWCFPWSIWICLYHVNLIGPSFITCSQSGIWVLNQEVDFNLDLNWGLRSNLTRQFLFHFHHINLVVNALWLSLFLPGTYFGTRAALAGALERWPTWSQAAIGIKVSASTSYIMCTV